MTPNKQVCLDLTSRPTAINWGGGGGGGGPALGENFPQTLFWHRKNDWAWWGKWQKEQRIKEDLYSICGWTKLYIYLYSQMMVKGWNFFSGQDHRWGALLEQTMSGLQLKLDLSWFNSFPGLWWYLPIFRGFDWIDCTSQKELNWTGKGPYAPK